MSRTATASGSAADGVGVRQRRVRGMNRGGEVAARRCAISAVARIRRGSQINMPIAQRPSAPVAELGRRLDSGEILSKRRINPDGGQRSLELVTVDPILAVDYLSHELEVQEL